MGDQFATLDKYIRSKQMGLFFVIMAIILTLFHPICRLKRKRALELQESIRTFNRDRLNSFGGTSLEKVK